MEVLRQLRHTLLTRALQSVMVRIRSGPLEGLKWSVASGSRFVLGKHKVAKTEALQGCIQNGDTVLDIGAHTGYYTVLSSLLAGPAGQVYAFEPRPLNFRLLTRHVERNKLDNVTLFESAVGQAPGKARFDDRTGTGTGSLSDDGSLVVDVVVIDDLYDTGQITPPQVLKIDVEGGEEDVLAGARRTINTCKPWIVLSTHGAEIHRRCMRYLQESGYVCRPICSINADTEGESAILAQPLRSE